MSAAALLTRLGLATLAFTVLAGGLVLARRALRERLGAEAVYALWLLVPLGVGLCCWPVHRELMPAAAAAAPVLQVGLLQPLPAA
jgi:beta-lactamase regulating signal transducer with metallopeptidase domain